MILNLYVDETITQLKQTQNVQEQNFQKVDNFDAE